MKNLRLLTFVFSLMLFLISCAEPGPKEINLGKDQCDHCKMTITEQKYATQLVTSKGRVYKFDDIICMENYANSNADIAKGARKYVVDFPSGKFIDAATATYITGGSIKSPMNGNTQAYKDKAVAQKAAASLGATLKK